MDAQIAQAYPTPVGKFRPTGVEAVNRELRRVILEREQMLNSEQYSNVGGWHSKHDLLDWPNPEMTVLRGWFLDAVRQMNGAATGGLLIDAPFSLVAWANVCRRGHYHRVHNHPASAWSGVYYVDAGADTSGQKLSGVLELCDPRPFSEMVPTPGGPFGKRVVFRAEAGTMILFPGFLYHFVNPFLGEGERISIAFNASWRS